MAHALRGRTAVIGIGTAGTGEAPGRSAIELLAEASLAAIADAGLTLPDVDAIFAATSSHAFPTLSVAEYLGIKPRFFDGTNVGGSSFEMHLLQAALALDAGLCNVALICYGSNQRTAGGRLVSMSEPQWHETPFKPPPSHHRLRAGGRAAYASIRHHARAIGRRGRRSAGLGQQEPGGVRPRPADAAGRAGRPDDQRPLTARDCCLVTDGGGACIMVRADRARDAPHAPAYLLGAAGAQWHRSIVQMPDLTVTAASESGPRAFEMAGIGRGEVDLLMLYDAFTINTILFLEDLGYCPKGEGGRFVEGGAIAPGGRLAVNTSGGGLSCVHPGMYGMFLIVEAVTSDSRRGGRAPASRCEVRSARQWRYFVEPGHGAARQRGGGVMHAVAQSGMSQRP